VTDRMFLLTPERWGHARVGEVVVLTGPEARHAVQVVRLSVGQRVLLGDGAGRRAVSEIISVGPGELTARLLEVETVPGPTPRFVLVQALAKGDRDEQAIEAATELGVDEVVPWQAARSIVQWRGEKEARGRTRWEALVTAAAKQSRRSRVPVVAPLERRAALCQRISSTALALVLHEDASQPLAGVALPDFGDVVVVVGPEGGITPEELEALTSAGAMVVRLGADVLRSSTAGPAALAVISAASRWR
jgi:16S rRNA (uracil1498-N3)-methyltransferase